MPRSALPLDDTGHFVFDIQALNGQYDLGLELASFKVARFAQPLFDGLLRGHADLFEELSHGHVEIADIVAHFVFLSSRSLTQVPVAFYPSSHAWLYCYPLSCDGPALGGGRGAGGRRGAPRGPPGVAGQWTFAIRVAPVFA